MTAWTQVHPAQLVTTPTGAIVDVDVEMVPLMTEIWRLRFTTLICCQDAGEAILGGGTRTPPEKRADAAARTTGRAPAVRARRRQPVAPPAERQLLQGRGRCRTGSPRWCPRTSPVRRRGPCACHGLTYVFRGKDAAGPRGAGLADVARRAGVSAETVSNVLNRPERVAERTRVLVEDAIAGLGFVRGGRVHAAVAAHWRRSGFATWIFQPAATGWFPPKSPQKARPVPLLADPFPGVPVRGRNAAGRAEANWTPIARGLTPHGLRHSHKTLMAELRTPEVLGHERLGHELEGIGGRYSHVTQTMRTEVCDQLPSGGSRRWTLVWR